MDPVSLALIAGSAEGIASTLTDAAINSTVAMYHSLKKLIKQRFGEQSKLSKAVDDLEEVPESQGRKLVLEEEVKRVQADQDQEILTAAHRLLEKLQMTKGQKIIRQTAVGNNIAQAASGSSASVNVTRPPKW